MTLKRYYLKWDYGYVLANSKKELMKILEETDGWTWDSSGNKIPRKESNENNLGFYENFSRDGKLKITEIRTANKKDILDWNEEYPNDEEESK